eukprot:TRINITY_DN15016_c0_g1_i1.p1 TRINITY_DN15016_c0_g1~~TRINITY_DN15016_c0_g1_i1.p1  ORF type:complete len:355 (-),score=115.42 TRINITY_DN15016_c0_g1_i1:219-1283(-)
MEHLPQDKLVGAVKDNSSKSKLFKPLTIRDMTIKNRFIVSPMCMYSSVDGFLNDFHLVHLGGLAIRGAGLIVVEATGVLPNGRISPDDSGIWLDQHIEPQKRIVNFAHSFGAKIGIQLAHAGRKASMSSPWKNYQLVPESEGGWPSNVWGPSAIAWDEKHAVPIEMSLDQIKETISAFQKAAERALKAGFDVIEIHGAHGYLIHNFLSSNSNHRTDEYGGSLENRFRFALEIVKAVRQVWPKEKPLFFRVSATDWTEEKGWNLSETVELARLLKEEGVDLLDVSSGGNSQHQKIAAGPGYQVPFAAEVKRKVPGLLSGAVGIITSGRQAEEILEKEEADVVSVAREFLRDASLV